MDTELTSLTPFEMIIPVEQEHIDQLNHVGNLIYVKWIQEAAINHWMTCAEPHLTETIAFVIARHEIDYKYSAKLGDTVVVKTWVGKTRKHLFERYTTIYRQSDSRVFVEALSLWCPIDIKTLSPMRPTEELISNWSVE
ncbi:MAG: acyl-CoA thioesterase [Ignavibacteriales bacterium]|nr:acyl-CoA thioesterase [Ignavibacteriales bacterium]